MNKKETVICGEFLITEDGPTIRDVEIKIPFGLVGKERKHAISKETFKLLQKAIRERRKNEKK